MASSRKLTSVFPGADPAVLRDALQFFQATEGANKLNKWVKKVIARPALHEYVQNCFPSRSFQLGGLTVQKNGDYHDFQRWLKVNQGSGHTYISTSTLHFYVITSPQGADPLIMTYMNFSNNWDNSGNVFLHNIATKFPVRLLAGFPVPEIENLFRLFACKQGVPLDFINSHLDDAGYSEKLLEFQLFSYFHLMTSSSFIEVPEELVQYRAMLEPYFLPIGESAEQEKPAAATRKRKREYNFE